MTLIRKVMVTVVVLVGNCVAGIASTPGMSIDLNSEAMLLNEAKPKEVRAVLFIEPTGETMKAKITFDPDLVDSLCSCPDNTRFSNSQVQNAIVGFSALYRSLSDIAGDPIKLKARLQNFIAEGRPLSAVFMLDYTKPNLELWHAANTDAYQQLSTTLRYEEYGTGEARDLSREQAARRAVFEENKAKKAIGGTGAVDAVKSTAVSVPSPVVAIDPTLPTVLLDDATLEDAMAVLLVKKTDHPSGVMYDIAFDSSILLGLLPENTKARETLRTLDPLLARFTNPTVRTFIEGMRQIYLQVMGRADDTYDKAAFEAVLNQLNATSRSLVVPFKLNPSSQYSLDFQNPFSGYAEEERKYDDLEAVWKVFSIICPA